MSEVINKIIGIVYQILVDAHIGLALSIQLDAG
jgi:hypothetical protein